MKNTRLTWGFCTATRSSVFILALGLLFSAVAVWGQMALPSFHEVKEGEELVRTFQPVIYRATAAEVDGKVVVRLSCPSPRLPNNKGAHNVAQFVYVWEDRKPLILGKEVKAYSKAGKELSKEAVLEALAKKVSVVYFERAKQDDPEQPDPIYTALFRDDVVVLVFQRP